MKLVPVSILSKVSNLLPQLLKIHRNTLGKCETHAANP
jgi:hypothetical protein